MRAATALKKRRLWDAVSHPLKSHSFANRIASQIWRYKWMSVLIIIVTIFQELAALWPANLLGSFIDSLSDDPYKMVWLLIGSWFLSPAIRRGNVVLRHYLFFRTEEEEREDLTLKEARRDQQVSAKGASEAHTRVVQAASAVSNTTHHVLGSFAPVLIKILVVSGSILSYNKILGMVYLATLAVPLTATLIFNNKLRVLRDKELNVISQGSGAGVNTIANGAGNGSLRELKQVLRERRNVRFLLTAKSQLFLYARETMLVASQALIILLMLKMRDSIGLTPGDFTKITMYMFQVAMAFINAVSFMDSVISCSRAYRMFENGKNEKTG